MENVKRAIAWVVDTDMQIEYANGEWMAYDEDGECRPATSSELIECGIYD